MIRVSITCEEAPEGGRYLARAAGQPEASMSFRRENGTMVIEDTDIPDTLPVDCVDRALVERAVMDARMEDAKLTAECPMARAMLARHPQWADVLAQPA